MKLMLAATATKLEDINLPCYVSPKFDGIRAIKRGEHLWSKSGKILPNKHLQDHAKFIPEGLEGEVVAVTDENMIATYSETSSFVMSRDKVRPFRFYAFDICSRSMEFKLFLERLKIMRDRLFFMEIPWLLIAPQVFVNNQEELGMLYSQWSLSYEGIMTRNPAATYKRGRATMAKQEIVKMKPFMDGEATITGWDEEMEIDTMKTVGKNALGALECVKDGVAFSVGTGFTREQREQFWERRESLIGMVITIKYQEVGARGAPRFPVFKGFRVD